MITGHASEFYEVVIPIYLQDTIGAIHEFEAILDTGFNGTLTLPTHLINSLQLPWRTRGNAILADGREDVFNIYTGTIIWDGIPRSILVEAVDMEPLLGMRLIVDHDVKIRVQHGGRVEITSVLG